MCKSQFIQIGFDRFPTMINDFLSQCSQSLPDSQRYFTDVQIDSNGDGLLKIYKLETYAKSFKLTLSLQRADDNQIKEYMNDQLLQRDDTILQQENTID